MEQKTAWKKLTKKQRGFVKDYAIDENGTQAVINHYDVKDRTVAASVSTENLRKPYIAEAVKEVKATLKDALEKEGVTAEKIAKKVNVLLNAKQEKKPDYGAIDKGINHAIKIRGDYAPEKSQNFNVNVTIDPSERIKELAKKLHDLDNQESK